MQRRRPLAGRPPLSSTRIPDLPCTFRPISRSGLRPFEDGVLATRRDRAVDNVSVQTIGHHDPDYGTTETHLVPRRTVVVKQPSVAPERSDPMLPPRYLLGLAA